MSDSFGPFQPKTHEVEDQSLDCVVFGRAVPTRSDTWTMIGQVAQSSARRANTSPSGWLQTGSVMQVPSGLLLEETLSAVDGQVLTSVDMPVDTFRLVSTGGLKAIVNGWVLDISGTNSTDSFNDVQLPSMSLVSTGRVDLVFLEVWRELVPVDSSLYQNGNVLSTSSSPVTTGVTPLVQLRYRIRAVSGPVSLDDGLEGFGSRVLSQGGSSTESQYRFLNMAAKGDPGLWRAGEGTAESKAALSSVDGYSYAIPMFGVYRRGFLASGYSIANQSSSSVSKLDGMCSDRPDGLFFDSVHASDIVDLRHRVANGADLKLLADKTFARLVAGELTTTRGEAHLRPDVSLDVPGGSVLSKCDVIGSPVSGAPHVGTMRVTSGLHKPRAACNASLSHRNNLVDFYPGTAWKEGSTYVAKLSGPADYAHYQVTAPYGAYTSDGSSVLSLKSDVVCSLSSYRNSWEITIPVGSSLAGTTSHVTFQYQADYQQGGYGLLDVPSRVLEVRSHSTGASIPTEGQSISPAKSPLSSKDSVANAGAESGSTWNTGITVSVVVEAAPGSDTVSLQLTNGRLHGHEVVGIVGVRRILSSGGYSDWKSHSVTREASSSTIVYLVSDIELGQGDTDSMQIVFQASTKFFDLSRNARGITNVYRTYEAPVVYKGGNYYVHTDGQPIVGITHYVQSGGVATPCAYVSGTRLPLKINSKYAPDGSSSPVALSSILPIEDPSAYVAGSYLPDRVLVEFDGTTTVRPTMEITVPVTVLSGIGAGESFEVHYTTNGYQGLLKSIPARGSIIGHSGYVVSSSGSGAVADMKRPFSAMFGSVSDKRVVVGAGESWLDYAQPGDYIAKTTSIDTLYRIASIESGSSLTLESAFDGQGDEEPVDCVIVRKDLPSSGHLCLADIMPSIAFDSFRYSSQEITGMGTDLSGCHRNIVEDPLASSSNDVLIGSHSKAFRGRRGVTLSRQKGSGSPRAVYGPITMLGKDVYAKVYQGWIFLNEATGRAYLAVSVGEYDGNNEFVYLRGGIGADAVDLFEIVGRPLVARG